MKAFLICACMAVMLVSCAGEPDSTTVTIKQYGKGIEVYQGDTLTSEWRAADGEIYRFQERLIEDDLYVAPAPSPTLGLNVATNSTPSPFL